MKRVLFVINTLGKGGAEAALMPLMKQMHLDGFSIDLLPLIPQGEMFDEIPEYVNIKSKKDSTSVHSKIGAKKLYLKILKTLIKKGFTNIPYLIKNIKLQIKRGPVNYKVLLWKPIADAAPKLEETYDIAIAYLEGAATYYVSKYIKSKFKVAFIHQDYKAGGYFRELDFESYKEMNAIFTVTEAIKQQVSKIYPEFASKIFVFHNLLDCERILTLSKEDSGFKDQFDGVRLLTIGSLLPVKGYDIAVKAMAILKDHNINVKWYVIGDGIDRGNISKLINQYHVTNDFILLLAKKNPYPYLRQCDLYIQPSRSEGWSIALSEARFFKKPIIASNCKGNLEQIFTGENGLTVDLEPEKLADAIEHLIADKAKQEKFISNLSHDNFDNFDLHLLYDHYHKTINKPR